MDNLERLFRIIEEYNLDGESVANMFLDWHGTQLLTDEFIDNLVEVEGYEID